MSRLGIVFVAAITGILLPAQPYMKTEVSRHYTVAGFTLEKDAPEKDTLADVAAKFGPSKILRCSNEEEAADEVGYLTADGRAKIVFYGDFSGAWTDLTGYRIFSTSLQRPCYKECPRSALTTEQLKSGGGLRLGLTRQEVIALLSRPKEVQKDALTFRWSSQLAWTRKEIERDAETQRTLPELQHWMYGIRFGSGLKEIRSWNSKFIISYCRESLRCQAWSVSVEPREKRRAADARFTIRQSSIRRLSGRRRSSSRRRARV